tara:strand:+ start:8463 stop:11717 length:3255 start_codon:yes stop_codon:yes gene_type:complete
MSKGKIKKYTLIDSFDKLDLSDFVAVGGPKGTGYEPLVKFASSAIKKSALDYKFLPRARDYKFLPDLFRFFVGRRFKLVKPLVGSESQWTLKSPPSQKVAGGKPRGADSAYPKINLLEAREIVDINFAHFSASFQFKDYFMPADNPEGATHYPAWGKTIPGIPPENPAKSLTRWEETTQAVGDFLKKGQSAALGPWWATTTTAPMPFAGPALLKALRPGLSMRAYREYQPQSADDKPTAAVDVMPLSTLSIEPYKHVIGENIWEFTQGLQKALYYTGMDGAAPTTLAREQTLFFRMLYQTMFPTIAAVNNLPHVHPFYTYFVADFDVATAPSEKRMEDGYMPPRNVKVTPYYNFYNELFELSPENVRTEWQLPNPYVYNAYKSSPQNTTGYFHQLIDLGNEIPISKDKLTVKDYVKLTRESSVFFKEGKPWAYSDIHPFSLLGALPYRTSARFNTIVLTDKLLMNSTKALKKAFPYGVEIDLGTQLSSGLLDLINQRSPTGGLINMFMTLLANNTTHYNTWNLSAPGQDISFAHRFIMCNDFVTFPVDGFINEEINRTLRRNVSMIDTQIFDLSQLLNTTSLEKFDDFYGPYINDEKNVKISNLVNIHKEKHGHADSMEVFHAAINTINDDLNEYLFNKAPTMREIYEGKKCHTEVIAYEIVKCKYVPGSGPNQRVKRRVQSIFIPNMFDKDTPLSYLDTQVFYDQSYVYEVYAHTLVVGAAYRYNGGSIQQAPLNAQGDSVNGYVFLEDGLWQYKAPRLEAPIVDSYAIIVRAPYYNNEEINSPADEPLRETLVADKPPLPPDIAFHPYEGVPDRLLMLLNQNYGERPLIPNTQIFAEDAAKIAAMKEAQKGEPKPQGHILYKTDDNRGTYEIYRLNRKPEKWSDFRDTANVKKITLNSLKQSGIDDIISPNVTYYYFARFVDVHGNISNPTNIFSVRIIKEEASPPYMVLEPFQFKKPEAITSIPFKKYIKITLSDNLRRAVGENAESADVAYQLKSGVGFKKYKFRVISQKTGKKIDINVDMNPQIVDKFTASTMAAVGGDLTGAPVTDPANPTGSEVYKEAEGLLNNANIINSSDTLCGD